MTQPPEQQPSEPMPKGFVPPGQPPEAPPASAPQPPVPPVMSPSVPQPKPRREAGVVVGLVAGAVVLVVAVVAGLWYLNANGKEAAGAGTVDRTSEATPTEAPKDLVGDGMPASPVYIDSFTMSEAKGEKRTSCEFHDPVHPVENGVVDVGTPDGGKVIAEGTQELSMKTSRGDLTITVDNEKSPCTAASFSFLSEQGYFDDSQCHRLTTEGIFVLQCGDPIGTGLGGPGYEFDNEFMPEDTAETTSAEDLAAGKMDPNYPAGTVAMANAGADTNGSQFFIVYKDTYLPPDYTIFGTVDEGLKVVEDIADEGAVAP